MPIMNYCPYLKEYRIFFLPIEPIFQEHLDYFASKCRECGKSYKIVSTCEQRKEDLKHFDFVCACDCCDGTTQYPKNFFTCLMTYKENEITKAMEDLKNLCVINSHEIYKNIKKEK